MRFHFSVFQPKKFFAYHSREYLSELPRSSRGVSFHFLLTSREFLRHFHLFHYQRSRQSRISLSPAWIFFTSLILPGISNPFLSNGCFLKFFSSTWWENLSTHLLPFGLCLSCVSKLFKRVLLPAIYIFFFWIQLHSLSTPDWFPYLSVSIILIPFPMHSTKPSRALGLFFPLFFKSFWLCLLYRSLSQAYFRWPPSLLCAINSIFFLSGAFGWFF